MAAADGGSPRALGREVTPGVVDTVIRLYVSNALKFTFDIPGTHYSGLTNQQLFEILASQDRDFAANTRTLRKYVAAELRVALEGARRLPLNAELERLAAPIILSWILKRMDAKVRDERLRALTPRYAEAKYRAGYHTPIGTRTGALRGAVAQAEVNIE